MENDDRFDEIIVFSGNFLEVGRVQFERKDYRFSP